MMAKVIFLLCSAMMPAQHQYMCSKSLEAATIQIGWKQSVDNVQSKLQAKVIRGVKRELSASTLKALELTAGAASVIQKRELALTTSAGRVADQVGVTVREGGASFFIRWNF